MTGYHITLGYMSNRNSEGAKKAWLEVVEIATRLCDHPAQLIDEAVTFGMSHERAVEFAQPYIERTDSTIRFKEAEKDTPAQIMQLAGGGGWERGVKEAMRRAFCRILLRECHARQIEININVA